MKASSRRLRCRSSILCCTASLHSMQLQAGQVFLQSHKKSTHTSSLGVIWSCFLSTVWVCTDSVHRTDPNTNKVFIKRPSIVCLSSKTKKAYEDTPDPLIRTQTTTCTNKTTSHLLEHQANSTPPQSVSSNNLSPSFKSSFNSADFMIWSVERKNELQSITATMRPPVCVCLSLCV